MITAILLAQALMSSRAHASSATPDPAQAACEKEFGRVFSAAVCAKFKALPDCKSASGEVLPFYEKDAKNAGGKRILVFGQIHGDEYDAGRLAAHWITRLDGIEPHNTWRVLPRLNPDGNRLKTRANAHGVDLNRNFPTNIWDEKALLEWRKKYKKNPRRYPGPNAGSEPETQCAVAVIKDFNPDIVVSIHTPYGLLDFDGPHELHPKFGALPWHLLGTFPGSLGRYEWIDHKVPVLTVELAPTSLRRHFEAFDHLQDMISLLVPKHSPKHELSTASK